MKKIVVMLLALLLCALCINACAEAPAVTNKGIMRISVSASDLEVTKAFFDDVMEMNFVAEGELDKATVKALYNMDATAKYAMYKNDLQNTLVQVLEFDPKPTKKAREGFAVQDGGYFDIAYRCQDNDEAYAKFTAMGYYVRPGQHPDRADGQDRQHPGFRRHLPQHAGLRAHR